MRLTNVPIAEEIICDQRLTSTDFKTLCIIKLFLRKRRKISIASVAKQANDSERTVYRAFERLRELNYIDNANKEVRSIAVHDKQDKEVALASSDVQEGIDAFKLVNPSFELLFKRKNQRQAVERMLTKMGKDKLLNAIEYAGKVLGQPYAPQITTPLQLEEKLGALVAFYKRNEVSGSKYVVTKI